MSLNPTNLSGYAVKNILVNSQYNQKLLAKECNISSSMMSQFLKGESSISEATARKMAKTLNLQYDEFLSMLKIDKASKTIVKVVNDLDDEELKIIKELLGCE